MSKAKVLKKYPNAHIEMIEGRVPMVSTGKRHIGAGRTKKEAWDDAYNTIKREQEQSDSAKEELIDSIVNASVDMGRVLTVEELLETIEESKFFVKKYLPKHEWLKQD